MKTKILILEWQLKELGNCPNKVINQDSISIHGCTPELLRTAVDLTHIKMKEELLK